MCAFVYFNILKYSRTRIYKAWSSTNILDHLKQLCLAIPILCIGGIWAKKWARTSYISPINYWWSSIKRPNSQYIEGKLALSQYHGAHVSFLDFLIMLSLKLQFSDLKHNSISRLWWSNAKVSLPILSQSANSSLRMCFTAGYSQLTCSQWGGGITILVDNVGLRPGDCDRPL